MGRDKHRKGKPRVFHKPFPTIPLFYQHRAPERKGWQHERVILLEELDQEQHLSKRPDVDHYRALAIRAIWAIVAPFGWDEEEVCVGHRRSSLDAYMEQ